MAGRGHCVSEGSKCCHGPGQRGFPPHTSDTIQGGWRVLQSGPSVVPQARLGAGCSASNLLRPYQGERKTEFGINLRSGRQPSTSARGVGKRDFPCDV